MPAVPRPAPPPPGRARGFHLPGRQPWARQQERRAHDEALFAFGELSLFVLLWNLEDFEAHRVARCSRCQIRAAEDDGNAALIFDAFKQSAEDRCPNCLGTTFEGGWKAKIVRPAIWDYSEERWSREARGYVTNLSGQVQTTSDFFMRDGDFILRGDGTRWKVKGGTTSRLHDGFGLPSRADSNLGYNYSDVRREEDAAIAFLVEPKTRTELTAWLDLVGAHFPTSYMEYDDIRGPILPEQGGFEPVDYRPLDNLPGPPGGAP